MSSFFGKLKVGSGSSSTAANNAKKDLGAPPPTPLEKLLQDAGPLREDGSDKFFGFENFGSTCYCNSVLQCLYYSTTFREQVVSFPRRSPEEVLAATSRTGLPRLNTSTSLLAATDPNTATSPVKAKNAVTSATSITPRKPPGNVVIPPGGQVKQEENKDSPDYKKKQALINGPLLAMNYENSQSYGMPESLFTSLKDIFEAIIAHRSRIGVVSPQKLLEVLRKENEMFRTAMHQDAHEFLNLLLNDVLENVRKVSQEEEKARTTASVAPSDAQTAATNPLGIEGISSAHVAAIDKPQKRDRWVNDLFEGILTSETRCLTCENTSRRDEAFLDLSVDLEEHSSVTSCLRKFSEEEMLCQRNKFHCDNCGGLQEAEKRMKIKMLPKILALHLKRFKFMEETYTLKKLPHRIVFPFHLRLFNTTDDAEDSDRLYELYAVVVHIGHTPHHGHYVAIIKTQGRGWLLFDDEMVEPVGKDYVQNFYGGHGTIANAYVLFYQETTLEAVRREQEMEGAATTAQASNAAAAVAKTDESQLNGAAIQNGYLRTPLQTPIVKSPEEESNMFAPLEHAVTAPYHNSPQSPVRPQVGNVYTSPNLSSFNPQTPLSSGGADSHNRKERGTTESQRRAQEKEAKDNAKTEHKNLTVQRHGAADDVAKDGGGSNDRQVSGLMSMSGSLNRFRPSSMSIRKGPNIRFWEKGSKEKEGSEVEAGPSAEPVKEPEKEKKSNRFSLGRKKSTMHL